MHNYNEKFYNCQIGIVPYRKLTEGLHKRDYDFCHVLMYRNEAGERLTLFHVSS